MNTQRLKKISQKLGYHTLPVRPGYFVEIHETVGEGNNVRTWRFKGLVIKVKKPNQADGTFTIRGKTAGHTIEKIYPLSYTKFEKVLLLDIYRVRRAKLYFIRDKVGKGARFDSIATAEDKGIDLLDLAKSNIVPREDDVNTDESLENTETEIDTVIDQAEEKEGVINSEEESDDSQEEKQEESKEQNEEQEESQEAEEQSEEEKE